MRHEAPVGADDEVLRAGQMVVEHTLEQIVQQDVQAKRREVPPVLVHGLLGRNHPVVRGRIEIEPGPHQVALGVVLLGSDVHPFFTRHVEIGRGVQAPGQARPVDDVEILRECT